ncbi:MAG: hypothetical protein ABIN99_12050 [Nitrosospira sp.]
MSFGSMEMDVRIKRETSRAGGQELIDPLVMFKAVLLGQWHNLSDPKKRCAGGLTSCISVAWV